MPKLLDYANYNPLDDPALFPTEELPTVRVERVLPIVIPLTGEDANKYRRIMDDNNESAADTLKRLLYFYVASVRSQHSDIEHVAIVTTRETAGAAR
jgi:hypothetical protein